MIIDTHCHIDMYENPLELASECEQKGIITIGMTNLPSHFEMGQQHLLNFKKVRLALGLHPLYAEYHKKELPIFLRNISKTSYIGEIGLDFSKDGIATREIQIESFQFILKHLKGKKKILSIHSRKAEKDVLNILMENKIQNAIFHWYSGSITLIDDIVRAGYFFSINPAMIKSKSGQAIIQKIPLEHLLTESDGPFILFEGRRVKPKDIINILNYISLNKDISIENISNQIDTNFRSLLSKIK